MRAAALRTYRQLLQAAWVREVPIGPVDETLERVDRVLREARIQFAFVGGFAVIEHGYERFTKDVDLLVRAVDLFRAMEVLREAGFAGSRTPIGARLRDERALARAGRGRRHLPVIAVEHLVLMKLESGRSKDDADVVELLKAGASSTNIGRYLRRTWPELLPRFRRLVTQARAERTPSPRGPSARRKRR